MCSPKKLSIEKTQLKLELGNYAVCCSRTSVCVNPTKLSSAERACVRAEGHPLRRESKVVVTCSPLSVSPTAAGFTRELFIAEFYYIPTWFKSVNGLANNFMNALGRKIFMLCIVSANRFYYLL